MLPIRSGLALVTTPVLRLRGVPSIIAHTGVASSLRQHAEGMYAQQQQQLASESSSSGGDKQTGGERPLQAFFRAAKRAVLAGTVGEAHPEAVKHLAGMMAGISLEELGLDPDAASDPFIGALTLHLRDNRIKYMRIYEDSSLTFGLFCFPEGATIPLHDHPGMTVLSRLLFGRLRVRAYDWVNPPAAPMTEGAAPARLVADGVVGPEAAPLVLFPASGGNLHEFTAETPCAVLDLLTPPYEPPERNCTYYRVQRPAATWPTASSSPRRARGSSGSSGSSNSGGGGGGGAPLSLTPRPRPATTAVGDTVRLEVFEPPDSFEVVAGLYPGDPVE